MDIRHLGFAADTFDGVWCPASVFFVPFEGMATALAEFERVLRPDGVARVGLRNYY
jgi:ubiquinone/menaquinone biosynthesis C-methylase UbiE